MLRLLLWLFRSKRLKTEDRALILNFLLESVGALPINDIITFDPSGTVLIKGKELTTEQAIELREGAVSLQKNWAYRVIKEQIAYEAVKYGVHSSLTFDMLIFSKSALWIQQHEAKLISDLTGE